MQADTLNCPMCGAPVASDATRCEHCGAPLASVVCSSCFSMMFAGSKFCPHCGAPAVSTAEVSEAGLTCPRCGVAMKAIQVGESTLRECPGCDGFWVERTAFEKICAEEQRQAAALGQASLTPPPSPAEPLENIRYVPCPQCGTLMNRVNFANCSGVILDVCKRHGVWFDRNELAKVVDFIRAGGLNLAEQRRLEQLKDEERRVRWLKMQDDRQAWGDSRQPAILAAGDLIHSVFGQAPQGQSIKLQ
jgi:Zn-finger nucleic acid-binding protein